MVTKCDWGVRREVLEGHGEDKVSMQRVLVPTQGYRRTFYIEILHRPNITEVWAPGEIKSGDEM